MGQLFQKYFELTKRQPAWYRLVMFAGLVPLIGGGVAHHRGAWLGLVCAVCMAAVFLPATLSPPRTRAWSARHPALNGLVGLPVFFAGALYWFRHLSAPWCLGIATVATAVLAVTGALRRRPMA